LPKGDWQRDVLRWDELALFAFETCVGDCHNYTAIMELLPTVAIGINLHVVPTAEGGRDIPLLGGSEVKTRFSYRPNWGLPSWADGEQAGAPVLGFSRQNIQPGETVRAVIAPFFFEEVPAWRDVAPGNELRMYEGLRICGRGTVIWVRPSTWPMAEEDQERFTRWLETGRDVSAAI
jgi:hypothetical protein